MHGSALMVNIKLSTFEICMLKENKNVSSTFGTYDNTCKKGKKLQNLDLLYIV